MRQKTKHLPHTQPKSYVTAKSFCARAGSASFLSLDLPGRSDLHFYCSGGFGVNACAALSGGRAQCLVFSFGPLRRRARSNTRRVIGKFLAVRNELEHRAPADIAAYHYIGSGELLSHQPRAFLYGFG